MINIILALILLQPIEVKEYNLANGLKVLIYEDHFAPVVSAQVHYRVGSYNESSGLTGISHLLEHMAFKGTKKYGPKEYNRIIEEAGGRNNAFTSIHRTVFYANLRSDRYELELELEADKMQNLLIPPDEFILEKDVVIEERRLGENDPHRNLFEHLDLVSFSYHPYRNPIIGFMSDIERLTRDDVYNWYKKYYNPANAIIIIAGDVNPEEALKFVKKHYGNINGKKEQDILFEEPLQNGEKRFELKKDIRTPALAIQYHAVGLNHEDMYAFDIISMILSFGMSSRFEKNLVREAGIATTINTYSSTLKHGGSFSILGIPQKGIDIQSLEKEIYNEIEKLKNEPVTDEELEKAKNQVLAQTIYRQDSAAGIGFALGWWEIEGDAWQNINRYPEEVQKLTKEDILEVAQKYFRKDNRTVGYLLPKEEK